MEILFIKKNTERFRFLIKRYLFQPNGEYFNLLTHYFRRTFRALLFRYFSPFHDLFQEFRENFERILGQLLFRFSFFPSPVRRISSFFSLVQRATDGKRVCEKTFFQGKRRKGSIEGFFENEYTRFSRHSRDVRGIMHWPFVPAILFHPPKSHIRPRDEPYPRSFFFLFLIGECTRGVHKSVDYLAVFESFLKKERRKKKKSDIGEAWIRLKKKGKRACVDEELWRHSSCVDKIFRA